MLTETLSESASWAIMAALAMMLLDIATGTAAAAKNGLLSSTKMREGLWNKAGMVFLIVMAWLTEVFVLHVPEIGIDVPLLVPACVLIYLMEAVSIKENIVKLSPGLKGNKVLDSFDTKQDKK